MTEETGHMLQKKRQDDTLGRIDHHGHRRTREASQIAFPYVDLYAAIEVAQAIYDRSGTSICDLADIADQLNDGVGGAFRLKSAAARIFDLLEKRGRSQVRLTTAGTNIVSAPDDHVAKAEAFLRVPLYAALYDKFRHHPLPQRDALEHVMKELGVPSKQVDKARQVFERSARQAGFFELSDSRLVHPASARDTGAPTSSMRPQNRNNSSVRADGMMDLDSHIDSYGSAIDSMLGSRFRRDDPLIVGLIDRLPAAGAAWDDEQRIAWLRLANSIFNVTYTSGGRPISIQLGDDTESTGNG